MKLNFRWSISCNHGSIDKLIDKYANADCRITIEFEFFDWETEVANRYSRTRAAKE